MRTIKTILTILIILTLLFFGTGMVVKENNYTSEVIVNKSLSETFRLFNNRESIMLWCPEIKKIETIEEKNWILQEVSTELRWIIMVR